MAFESNQEKANASERESSETMCLAFLYGDGMILHSPQLFEYKIKTEFSHRTGNIGGISGCSCTQ